MSNGAETEKKAPGEAELQDLVAQTDSGARTPHGPVGVFVLCVALAWSLFQIWYASPLPFITGFLLMNDTEARAIHLGFGIFLAFTAYPALKRSPRDYIPIQDWVLALVGAFTASYLYWFYDSLAQRPGLPTTFDLGVAIVGMVTLLEATRRALGPPLMIVALVFLAYVFFGDAAWVPTVLQWKGASIDKAMSHQWLTTEGVFGIALGVSTSFVFLFVLFGALLEKAGAGNYFIKVAFAALGHLRGGPAKAAVISSAMTGLISGSSIANVVTTGTFTIPLMKRVGFSGDKAGAVEVASSVNGQIMPPVMGAAAFLMVEYVGISYAAVVKHAFLPATISYMALIYIVHLEAMKAGLEGLPRRGAAKTLLQKVNGFLIGIAAVAALALIVYYGIGWQKDLFGEASAWVLGAECLVVYVVLIGYSARFPDLELDDPNAPVVELPELGPTAKSGYYYLLPVVVLIWFLMIEQRSPGLSAFWASTLMIFILITQKPLKAIFRGTGELGGRFADGIRDLVDGLVTGARNMIGIAVATATAGIIVGTVSLTGIGQVMVQFVEIISGGNLMLILIFTAFISLILGMGLPTTANYIVVSSLMAPVVVELGAESGLIVPLIAVHLFVFYFGIMADVTPPVGLASFAAAAVSGADPLKTGFVAFFYSLRTALLPFLFLFNTQLLLIGVDNILQGLVIFIVAAAAMLIFAAATQGYFFARNRIYESVLLLLVAFTLFRPGFFMDMITPPFEDVPGSRLVEVAGEAPPDSMLRMVVKGETFEGDLVEKTVMLPLGPAGGAEDRLRDSVGIEIRTEDGGRVYVDNVVFAGAAEKAGVDFDWEIVSLKKAADRPPKELLWIPAIVVLALIVMVQRRRSQTQAVPAKA